MEPIDPHDAVYATRDFDPDQRGELMENVPKIIGTPVTIVSHAEDEEHSIHACAVDSGHVVIVEVHTGSSVRDPACEAERHFTYLTPEHLGALRVLTLKLDEVGQSPTSVAEGETSADIARAGA